MKIIVIQDVIKTNNTREQLHLLKVDYDAPKSTSNNADI